VADIPDHVGCGLSHKPGDDRYEYVFYLDTEKGELRPLNEAQAWNVDRSAEEPARAEALRAALHARFPEIVPAK